MYAVYCIYYTFLYLTNSKLHMKSPISRGYFSDLSAPWYYLYAKMSQISGFSRFTTFYMPTMVPTLEGNSGIGAHLCSEIGILT